VTPELDPHGDAWVARLRREHAARVSQRWIKVCQSCWQAKHPDQYCPELSDYAECVVCGESGLVLSAHPEDFR
jgi:ribosomal protein L32